MRKAYELIDAPHKWCRYALWQDADGKSVVDPKNAVSFCAVGAIAFVYNEDKAERNMIDKLNDYTKTLGYHWACDWNNDPKTTWNEVYSTLKELDI